jgi:hypothetical protein
MSLRATLWYSVLLTAVLVHSAGVDGVWVEGVWAQGAREPDVFEMRRRCQSAAERLSEPMLKAMQVGKIQYRVEVKSNYDPETKKCVGLIDSANMAFASSELQYHYSYLYNAYSGDILASITQSKNNTVAVIHDEHYEGPKKGLDETRAYIKQMMTIKQ